jgi:hypothetical protein
MRRFVRFCGGALQCLAMKQQQALPSCVASTASTCVTHGNTPVLLSSAHLYLKFAACQVTFTSTQVESSPCRSRRIRHDVICHPTGIPTSLDYNRPQPLVTSTSRTTKTHQPCANHRKLNYRHAPITSLQTPINSAAVFKHPPTHDLGIWPRSHATRPSPSKAEFRLLHALRVACAQTPLHQYSPNALISPLPYPRGFVPSRSAGAAPSIHVSPSTYRRCLDSDSDSNSTAVIVFHFPLVIPYPVLSCASDDGHAYHESKQARD